MATQVFVNELHYDNDGADLNEAIEIAGPAGTDLTGWRIQFYNGSGGAVYDTITLSGTIPNLTNGFGTLAFTRAGLQNGSPDGFALVNAAGVVVQFLSYEGSFTAVGGAANGMTSVNIGVEESGTSPVGFSLQLTGTGTVYEDFTWAGSRDDNFGAVNTGQTFLGEPEPGQLSIADSRVTEGEGDPVQLEFVVTRTGGSSGAVSATYTVSFVSASAADLPNSVALTGTVEFADGETSKTIVLPVNDDERPEDTETLTVTLSDATGGATINEIAASATGTIIDNDVVAPAPIVFINEIHYDNDGADVSEAIELAGLANIDLAGWQLVLYNGNGGAVYDTINLSGIIPNQDDGYGTISFNRVGIQNGSPDGIALVNAQGEVIQFLSYEGSFVATNGPAAGLTSIDIGVAEATTSPAGFSLQLTGEGQVYEDFQWAASRDDSFGSVNDGQDFGAPNPNGSLRIRDASVLEANETDQTISFVVQRGGGTTGTVTADYSVVFNGNANAADLSGTIGGTVTFEDGQSEATISLTVAGDTAVEPDETFSVVLSNATGGANIVDGNATGTIINDDVSLVAIHVIQGAGHVSAFAGQQVTTSGIVTAVDGNGFYMQDPTGDGDTATSDAIFVFTSAAPTVAVGDAVQVRGNVAEFQPGGAAANGLTVTQLTAPLVTVVSSGNALPQAVFIGSDGRKAPTEIIDDDNFSVFDPENDGIDFWESLEAMRVTVESPVAVAPTSSFGEIWTLPSAQNSSGDRSVDATSISGRGHAVINGNFGDPATTNSGPGSDFNPERIQIDPDTEISGFAAPNVAAGTVFDSVTGVINYGFGNYELIPTSALTIAQASQLTDETTELRGVGNQFTLATYNTLNLDPNDSDGDTDVADGRFTQFAFDIATNLSLPDVVVLQEIQDNDGSVQSGTVSASVTLQMLSDEIFAASGVRYSWVDNPFVVAGQVGGEPGGNIRVAFLYRADRVELDEASVTTILTDNGQLEAAFSGARTPLIADFKFNGETVTVIGNHFTSKGGSSPLYGNIQPSINGGAESRAEQAAAVNAYVSALLAADASTNVVVAGDLNEFQFEEALGILSGDLNRTGVNAVAPGDSVELINLINALPPEERYSYIFEGNAQALDHILATGALAEAAAVDYVHINSYRSGSPSDHDPAVASFTLGAVLPTQVVSGTTGDDDLNGGNGDQALYGFAGNDRLRGGAGDDVLFGGQGNDELSGGQGNDRLYGGAGNDVLFGGEGNDLIVGGQGQDRLQGSTGADRFVFEDTAESLLSAPDAIVDFARAQGDIIDLSDMDANTLAVGDQAFTLASRFTGVAGELVITRSGRIFSVQGDVDGDGIADFLIQVTSTGALGAQDFAL